MQKIINGLVYDTDKLELVYKDPPPKFSWGVSYVYELYRSPKARYLLIKSCIASLINVDPVWSTMTEREAKEWLGKYNAAAYVKTFGQAEEA